MPYYQESCSLRIFKNHKRPCIYILKEGNKAMCTVLSLLFKTSNTWSYTGVGGCVCVCVCTQVWKKISLVLYSRQENLKKFFSFFLSFFLLYNSLHFLRPLQWLYIAFLLENEAHFSNASRDLPILPQCSGESTLQRKESTLYHHFQTPLPRPLGGLLKLRESPSRKYICN